MQYNPNPSEMKLKNFFVYYCTVVVALTAISLMSVETASFSLWRTLIIVVAIFAPAFLVWLAEGEGLKQLCSEYLSFKSVNWKNAVAIVASASVWFTLVPVFTVFVVGNVLGFTAFGQLLSGSVDVYGLFSYNASSAAGFLTAVAANILISFITGTISSIVVIFSEIAWRGFLPKYMSYGRYMLPIAIGALWTLWEMPNLVFAQSLAAGLLVLIKNIALSYLLLAVVRKTGSVWVSAAMVGVISVGLMVPMYAAYSIYASTIPTAVTALALWWVVSRLVKTNNRKTQN